MSLRTFDTLEVQYDTEYEYDDDSDYSLSDTLYPMDSEYGKPMSFVEITTACVLPTLYETSKNFFLTLLLCFLFQIINKFSLVKVTARHLICGLLGIFVMHLHLYSNLQMMILHSIVLPLVAHLVIVGVSNTKHLTWLTSVTLLSYLTICEFIVEGSSWSHIRSVQMIIAMKVISLVSDLKNGRISSLPTTIQFFGYIFYVGNSICGPWINYKVYLDLLEPKRWNAQYLLRIASCVLLSLLFFVMSTCYLDWLTSDSLNADLWTMYKTALAFRNSHYFVSFMSESFILAAGHIPLDTGCVTNPRKIECPHSLVEVVIYWNVPMHKWLKLYVFKPLNCYNRFVAVIGTYFVSSLLHGLNYQLSAILLSLAVYTFIEHTFREKLARRLNACILSKRCTFDCQNHRYNGRMLTIAFINLFFTIIAVYHLSYLGYLIDQSIDHKLTLVQSFYRWSEQWYCSHFVALVTFVISWIL